MVWRVSTVNKVDLRSSLVFSNQEENELVCFLKHSNKGNWIGYENGMCYVANLDRGVSRGLEDGKKNKVDSDKMVGKTKNKGNFYAFMLDFNQIYIFFQDVILIQITITPSIQTPWSTV